MFPLLETLVAVYEVGQFTLAADELKVSQSTVSSRIAQLEQMVGAPLFVRNAKSDVMNIFFTFLHRSTILFPFSM